MDLVQPLLDEAEWDVETLQRALECFTCSTQTYNHWMVCVRKYCSINLHLEYVSRKRQTWFIAILPTKYLPIPMEYVGPIFKFKGIFMPRVLEMTSKDPAVPIKLRKSKVIAYGE